MTTQLAIQDIKGFIKRRRLILILSPILIAGLSFGLSYLMTPKYESTISILVQKEETLNPLISYKMAVNLASDDRLRSFNEIIYSRATIEKFINELKLNEEIETHAEKQELIRKIRKNIMTVMRASDSFDISYLDSNPDRAKRGVEFLANHFIKTRLELENKRNEETVEFFEEKLAELSEEVQSREEKMLQMKSKRLELTPADLTALQSRVDELISNIEEVEWRIQNHQKEMRVLEALPVQVGSRKGFQTLYELQLANLPFSSELQDLMKEYDELRNNFTDQYPAVKKKEEQILELAARMPLYIESDIKDLQKQRDEMVKHKNLLLETMSRVNVDNQQTEVVVSDYSIYKGLYDDMKVKLEQARTSRDLGNKATNQFIVIDPAYRPEKPVSPNKVLLTAVGLVGGLFLGLFSAILFDFMDTSIRTPQDLGIYRKTVVAYLPELR